MAKREQDELRGERLEMRYVPLSTAVLWEKNPKQHDMGAIIQSIEQNGFVDPPKFDAALGALVFGNGRTHALQIMARDGKDRPRGILENEGGEWMRPFAVLSNGEKFRVELARRLLECADPIVVDEFTSVVDRQVAQIGAHAVQKFVRRNNRQFVAASCHYDIVEWLQPDWTLEPATMDFTWRSLQRRPAIDCNIGRVPYAAWRLFAPYHYLTAALNPAARCYALWVGDRIAAFAGVLYRPHPKTKDIYGVSRLVTLPDWQGLGLAFVLVDELGKAFKGIGKRLHTYPAHPALIRGFDRSEFWAMKKRPGLYSPRASATTTVHMGGRPCAVFEFQGPKLPAEDAERFLGLGR